MAPTKRPRLNPASIDWPGIYDSYRAEHVTVRNFHVEHFPALLKGLGQGSAVPAFHCLYSHLQKEAKRRGEKIPGSCLYNDYGSEFWAKLFSRYQDSGLCFSAFWKALPEPRPTYRYCRSKIFELEKNQAPAAAAAAAPAVAEEKVAVLQWPEEAGGASIQECIGEEVPEQRITMELPYGCKASFLTASPEESIARIALILGGQR